MLRVTTGAPPEFIPHELPDQKDQIEMAILRQALDAASAQQIELYDLQEEPIQNAENDFDFTLRTPAGNEFLDLVEFVAAGGYTKAPSRYNVGDMAERLFDLVRMKARKYGYA